jgi:hypothetical protein
MHDSDSIGGQRAGGGTAGLKVSCSLQAATNAAALIRVQVRDAQRRDGESTVVCLVTLNGMRVDGEKCRGLRVWFRLSR